jgi:hypothetical protein
VSPPVVVLTWNEAGEEGGRESEGGGMRVSSRGGGRGGRERRAGEEDGRTHVVASILSMISRWHAPAQWVVTVKGVATSGHTVLTVKDLPRGRRVVTVVLEVLRQRDVGAPDGWLTRP